MQKIQSFFMGWVTTFKQQGFVGKLLLVAFSLMFLCLLCGVPIVVLSPATPTPEIENTIVVEAVSTPVIIDAVTSTNIPMITVTNTPEPPTSVPTTKEPYIYLFEVSSLVFLDHDANRGNGEGLKVYMGEQKAYVFEIIGGGNCPSMPSGQGYLVRYSDTGNIEWKDRRAMEESELFVENDSLALFARDWTVYFDCP